MKGCVFFYIVVFFFVGAYSFAKQEVITKKIDENQFFVTTTKDPSKKSSKGEVKEKLGEEIGNALNTFNNVQKKMGEVQVQLAALQKQLFVKIEQILENGGSVKKASRVECKGAFGVVKEINTAMAGILHTLACVEQKLHADPVLRIS